MLDGRVLEASQVEYKPFGKPPLQREGGRSLPCQMAQRPPAKRLEAERSHQRRRIELLEEQR